MKSIFFWLFGLCLCSYIVAGVEMNILDGAVILSSIGEVLNPADSIKDMGALCNHWTNFCNTMNPFSNDLWSSVIYNLFLGCIPLLLQIAGYILIIGFVIAIFPVYMLRDVLNVIFGFAKFFGLNVPFIPELPHFYA